MEALRMMVGKNDSVSLFHEDWQSEGFPRRFNGGRMEKAEATSGSSRLGVDFVRASKDVFEFELHNGSIVRVSQNVSNDNLGSVVWDAGILLARLMDKLVEKLGKDWASDQSVIELGSGTGIVGLACAGLGFGKCVLTDTQQGMDLIQENLNMNGFKNVSSAVFKWGSDEVKDDFSLLLCSDVLYDSSVHEVLVETLQGLARSCPGFLGLLSIKFRNVNEEIGFLETIEEAGFKVLHVRCQLLCQDECEMSDTTATQVFAFFPQASTLS